MRAGTLISALKLEISKEACTRLPLFAFAPSPT